MSFIATELQTLIKDWLTNRSVPRDMEYKIKITLTHEGFDISTTEEPRVVSTHILLKDIVTPSALTALGGTQQSITVMMRKLMWDTKESYVYDYEKSAYLDWDNMTVDAYLEAKRNRRCIHNFGKKSYDAIVQLLSKAGFVNFPKYWISYPHNSSLNSK